ncbi:RNA polymerase sigma factor [Pedobacter sp. GR22-10]|uniref:RNA polymerase sigma factor n=1 Tax=Pedobacter TaxID=84567 RepID=UPI0022467767|nr:RNA polymerase sigma-70 factor [Pedobacter sp. GR22-10]MCX2430476.1 RNA polymerase sigma-70 factor [Pedobacter sp. GR22-10]
MIDIKLLSDNELFILLKQDDHHAFTEIYDRYAVTLAAFAGSRLYHLEVARDLLHDLFVKLWEDRHSIEINTNLKTYLYSAVRYKVIDKIRENLIREKHAAKEQVNKTTQQYTAQDQLEAEELQKSIDKSLEALPRRTRQIFLLSRTEHRSISEIAKILNLSEQTVKNQLSSALKHLRTSINNNLLAGALVYLWFH